MASSFVVLLDVCGESPGVVEYVVPADWSPEMRSRVESGALRARLGKVLSLISKYSKSLNLSGASTTEELGEQAGEAVLGVLAVEAALGRALTHDDRWLDVGSGGGFPGLVVGAVSETDLRLVEPRQRRAAFLEMGMGSCGRRGGVVSRGRLEGDGLAGVSPGLLDWLGEGADVVSARAVFEPAEWARRSVSVSGGKGLVLLHLHVGGDVPVGVRELARREWKTWAAVVAVAE